MWMASENVKQQSQRNNLGMSFGDQLGTHSFGDTMQEEDNCTNTKKSNDSPELETVNFLPVAYPIYYYNFKLT